MKNEFSELVRNLEAINSENPGFASTLREMADMLDAGEYVIALEILLDNIYEYDAIVGVDEKKTISEIFIILELKLEDWVDCFSWLKKV